MDAILQKIKADITGRPLVSILIVTTIVVSSMLLTLALTTLLNISAPYDKSFEDLNAAHLWLHFNRDKIRERDINRIKALPNIVETTELQYSVPTRVKLDDTRVWVSLRAMPTKMPPVNKLLVLDGNYLSTDQSGLLAGKDLNDLYRLNVGENIGITRADGKTVSLPVIGLAYNPTWDIYRNTQFPYIYVTEEMLRELYPNEKTWDWSIGLRLADPQSVEQVLADIKNMLRKDTIDTHTDWREVRESAMFGNQLHFLLLGAFSLFAIVAIMFIVASNISSTVHSQFRQIGLLKAIGFTQSQILLLYLGQYLILGLTGSFIGLLLGIVLSPLALEDVAASLNTTFRPSLKPEVIILVLSIVPGVVILATLSTAYKGAKANIIKAIAVGAEAPSKRPFWGTRLATYLGLPVTFMMGLNDVFTKPLRSFMTGINLMLGVIGIIFGLTLNNTLSTYADNPFLLGIVHDGLVTRDETGQFRTEQLLESAPGVEAFYSQYVAEVETLNGETFEIKAVEGDLTAFPFIIRGRLFEYNTYEAIAGQGLLDWLALEVGDDITVLIEDKPVTWHIVGQYPEPANAGQMLMVSLPTLAQTLRHAKPKAYYLKLNPTANPNQLKKYLEPKPDSDLNLSLVDEVIPDSVAYLQYGIFTLAAILIGIALINVFNTSMMTMQERLRLIGVLKTVGMTPAQVMRMVNTTAGILGFAATVVGIPVGILLTRELLDLLSQGYGFGLIYVTINFFYVMLLFPLVISVSILGSFIPSRRAAKLAIVSVLRHE